MIVVVAPIVEELTFRGLGYSLLVRYGKWAAIVLTGLAFGLAHGLVEALPFLAAFGMGLAYLRSRVRSVYPGMIVHGLFNAVALTLSVAGNRRWIFCARALRPGSRSRPFDSLPGRLRSFRVPMWVAPQLYKTIPYGETVYVY